MKSYCWTTYAMDTKLLKKKKKTAEFQNENIHEALGLQHIHFTGIVLGYFQQKTDWKETVGFTTQLNFQSSRALCR